VKHRTTVSDSAHFYEVTGEIREGQELEYEIEIPDGFDRGAVLVESRDGSPDIVVSGISADERSHYERVKLRAGRLAAKAKRLTVRVKSQVTTQLRVTVAVFKRESAAAWCTSSSIMRHFVLEVNRHSSSVQPV
jgi:hypothetical protein